MLRYPEQAGGPASLLPRLNGRSMEETGAKQVALDNEHSSASFPSCLLLRRPTRIPVDDQLEKYRSIVVQ